MILKVTSNQTTFKELKATETFWFRGDIYLKVRDSATNQYKAVDLVSGRIVEVEEYAEVQLAPTYLIDAAQERFEE